MIAVSDAGSLNYLVQIGGIDLLPILFERIVVPPAVLREINDEGAPQTVRLWASALPSWIEVREPSTPVAQNVRGETAAIALAQEFSLPLLCDDLSPRRAAARMGIAVSGTLGVLQQAHAQGLIEIGESLERLAQTNFHAGEGLFERVKAEARQMRAETT